MDPPFYFPGQEPPPELAGMWCLAPPELDVTTEGPTGTSSMTVSSSLFSATSYIGQDQHSMNPQFTCVQPSSFNDGHYNTPSSSISFSLHIPGSPPPQNVPSSHRYPSFGDDSMENGDGWPIDEASSSLERAHDEWFPHHTGQMEPSGSASLMAEAPVPHPPDIMDSLFQAFEGPSQNVQRETEETARPLKRRRSDHSFDSRPSVDARQQAIPTVALPPLFTRAPLVPRPRRTIQIDISQLNILFPESLNTARAASSNWSVGWQLMLGSGVTVEVSNVAVSIADQFPTKAVTTELQLFHNTIRERRRQLLAASHQSSDEEQITETQEEEDEAVHRIVLAEQGMKGNEAVVAMAHRKVHGTVRKLVKFVIDLIVKKDIFGLVKYNDEDCKGTLKLQLGWLATTMYHMHLFLTHRRCSGIRLTDFKELALHCPMAGETIFTWLQVESIEGALLLCRTLSFARIEQGLAREGWSRNVEAIKPAGEKRKRKRKAKAEEKRNKGKGKAKADLTDSPETRAVQGSATASSSNTFNPAINIASSSLMQYASDPAALADYCNTAENPFAFAPQMGLLSTESHPVATQNPGLIPGFIPAHAAPPAAENVPGPSTEIPAHQPAAPQVIFIPPAEDDDTLADYGDDIIYHADAEPTSDRYRGPRQYVDGFLRARMRSAVGRYWEQDILGTAMNFHGSALHMTASRMYHIISNDYIDPRTGHSPVRSFYEDQLKIAPGSTHDYVYRTSIIPSAIDSCILQVMYDKATLDITVDDVMNNHRAILTLESKIQTARTQMESWMKKSPKEYKVYHGRVMNMFGVINQTHPIGNPAEYMQDMDKTFIPGDSDHLAKPNQSWTSRYHSSDIAHPDTRRMRAQMLQGIPETRHLVR